MALPPAPCGVSVSQHKKSTLRGGLLFLLPAAAAFSQGTPSHTRRAQQRKALTRLTQRSGLHSRNCQPGFSIFAIARYSSRRANEIRPGGSKPPGRITRTFQAREWHFSPIPPPNATKPLLFCCVHWLPKKFIGRGQPMNAFATLRSHKIMVLFRLATALSFLCQM